ncbi:MAG: carbon-nitrogen hydrolase family protein [Henriciella sp.]|nr:carbon-nitrogen hydrolase family protein [Henriciella sp.]
MSTVKVACLQMRCGTEVAPNIITALTMIEEAAKRGATLIATPEMTNIVDIRPGLSKGKIVSEAASPALAALRAEAKQRKVWLLIGSLALTLEDDPRKANRSFLIDPDGEIVARYDKINMFDVEVDDGQSYRESRAYRPGDKAVLADTPFGKIGLTICYDLRFPQLYRSLVQAGADILTCPAAFTKVTGEAHWHALLRARAIETGSFVLAPAQGGRHQDGRETYGHAMIVSPWGEIQAEADHAEPTIVTAELDLSEVAKARRKIPSLSSDRPFNPPG